MFVRSLHDAGNDMESIKDCSSVKERFTFKYEALWPVVPLSDLFIRIISATHGQKNRQSDILRRSWLFRPPL